MSRSDWKSAPNIPISSDQRRLSWGSTTIAGSEKHEESLNQEVHLVLKCYCCVSNFSALKQHHGPRPAPSAHAWNLLASSFNSAARDFFCGVWLVAFVQPLFINRSSNFSRPWASHNRQVQSGSAYRLPIASRQQGCS